jgi:uncharacterized protein involved in type VI secretion and phage assembly
VSMEIDLLGLLNGQVGALRSELDRSERRVFGVTLGVVTAVGDGKHLGRVKVRFPWLSDQVESGWSPIATPWAGLRRGSYLLPEVDDEALVAFRHGDPRHAYVLGFLWSEQARPPEPDPGLERRGLYSKRGHKLVFDDSAGHERMLLESQGGHLIVLDDDPSSGSVSIVDSTGSFSITVDGRHKNITLQALQGDIGLTAQGGTLRIEAASIDIHSTGSLALRSDATLTINGAQVTIN